MSGRGGEHGLGGPAWAPPGRQLEHHPALLRRRPWPAHVPWPVHLVLSRCASASTAPTSRRAPRRPPPLNRTHLRTVLALLVMVGALWPGLAYAHASLERADPPVGARLDRAPRQLRLVFTEPLDPGFSRVEVLDARREGVDRGGSRVDPNDPRAMIVALREDLPDGVYTVVWRTLSTIDGHTVNGAYPLVIGTLPEGMALPETAATTEVVFAVETAAARGWLFVTASVLFGSLLVWLVLYRPLLTRAYKQARPAAARRARWLALGAAGALVFGILWGALAQAAAASGGPLAPGATPGGALFDLLSRGRFAAIWWTRLSLAVVALTLVAWRGVDGWSGRLALVVSAGVLLTSSLTGHSAALVSGPHLAVAIDWLHFLAVAAWIGGLASLVVVLPAAASAAGPAGDRIVAQGILRFSGLALVTVPVLVASGLFLTWLHVGSLEGLWQTGYGLAILAKVVGLVVMLALAAFNLLIVRPRLQKLAGTGSAAATRLRERFEWAVRGEVAAAVLVLVAAAVLTGISPAREELAQLVDEENALGPVDREVETQTDLRARILITPATVGQNQFAVELPGITNPAQVERVQLTLTYLDEELGSQPLILQPVGGGRGLAWAAESPLLSLPGRWQAELFVRRPAKDDARTAIRFLVAGPGFTPRGEPPAAVYPLLPSASVSFAYALLAAGFVVVLVGVLPGGRRARQGQIALVAAGLFVALCGGYVYAREQREGVPLDVENVRNPIPPDDRSLAAGKEIYLAHCAVCHGETGRGDGPAGLRLVPRPADLREHMAAGHTDGEIFYWVSYGVQGTAMPGWKDELTEQQRWDVINYIRTFANGQ